jgi:hypothetical protein
VWDATGNRAAPNGRPNQTRTGVNDSTSRIRLALVNRLATLGLGRAVLRARETARRPGGHLSWRSASSMTNFARLVRFCWPYRGRFAVSIGCAVMVALLWFTELGAVYPLLQVLLNNENTQGWIVAQIDEKESEELALEARLEQIAFVRHALTEPGVPRPLANVVALIPKQHVEQLKLRRSQAEAAYLKPSFGRRREAFASPSPPISALPSSLPNASIASRARP